MANEFKYGPLAGYTRWQYFCYCILPMSIFWTLVIAAIEGLPAGIWVGSLFALVLGAILWASKETHRVYLLLAFMLFLPVFRSDTIPPHAIVTAIVAIVVVIDWAIQRRKKQSSD